MNNFSLPKKVRLLKRAQFLKLSKKGKKTGTSYLIAAVEKTCAEKNRIGITVSKKVGNAVERNRIKRIIREYFRHRNNKISIKRDINIIGKKGLADLSNSQILVELEKLFNKIEST